MTRRKERVPKTPLPRPEPCAEFLQTGPKKKAINRRRIASAGNKVSGKGLWPSFERVRDVDPRIKIATLGRNADALDEARASWVRSQSLKIAGAGDFPTIELLQVKAGRVRRSFLERFEDAMLDARRLWVEAHGTHPDWTENSGEQPLDECQEEKSEVSHTPSSQEVAELQKKLALANKRIDRLMGERKQDRATIETLKRDLADSQEALRRSTFVIRNKYAAHLNQPSAAMRP